MRALTLVVFLVFGGCGPKKAANNAAQRIGPSELVNGMCDCLLQNPRFVDEKKMADCYDQFASSNGFDPESDRPFASQSDMTEFEEARSLCIANIVMIEAAYRKRVWSEQSCDTQCASEPEPSQALCQVHCEFKGNLFTAYLMGKNVEPSSDFVESLECPVSGDAVPVELAILPFEMQITNPKEQFSIIVTGEGAVTWDGEDVGQLSSNGSFNFSKTFRKEWGLPESVTLYSTGEITSKGEWSACGRMTNDEEGNLVVSVTNSGTGDLTIVIGLDLSLRFEEIPLSGVLKGPPEIRKTAAFVLAATIFK